MSNNQYLVAGEAIAHAQAQDQKGSIPYRPQYNHITGKVTASILLQQITYWWFISNRKPFYKFRAPCDHERYREGDSWTEELGMTIYEFDGALKRISAKVTKGASKTELLNSNLVIYWTDADRVTWYQVNEPLLFECIYLAYNDPDLLGKQGFPIQLTKQEKPRYMPTETTTEITTKQHVASDALTENPPEQPSEQTGDELLDSYGLGLTEREPIAKSQPLMDLIGEDWAYWGYGSEVFQRQLQRFGVRGRRVQKLGYELEKAVGMCPVWKMPKKVRGWMAGLSDCLTIAEDDAKLVVDVARQMRKDKLTIKNPYSLHGTIADAVSKKRVPSQASNEIAKIKAQMDADPQVQTFRKLAQELQ